MKNLPLWPFLAFRTIAESVSYTESICDWGTNPPPATKPNTPVCGNTEYRRIGVSTKQIPRSLGNVVPAFPIFGGGHPNGTQVACNSCFAKRLFDELKVVRLSDEAQLAELEFSETQEE